MPAKPKKNRKPEKNKEGSFRIIGGEHGSRRLSFPEAEGLRPTTDRVKETVFNWLRNEIPGATVLDLFAGSGALGFEAASRGASNVQFVELNSTAASYLQSNCARLKLDATVARTDALSYLQQSAESSFDLIFIDPPFRKGLVDEVLQTIKDKRLLKPNGLVYLETEAELAQLQLGSAWRELKAKKAGQVSYRLFIQATVAADKDAEV